jgi:hypothetical protein
MTGAALSPKADIYDIADRLWEKADELRANSRLEAADAPCLCGSSSSSSADGRFSQVDAELVGTSTGCTPIRNTERP